MTKAEELRNLAAQCEEATHPTPELRDLVATALGWKHFSSSSSPVGAYSWHSPDGTPCKSSPDFVGSLDAVATIEAPLGHPLWTQRVEHKASGDGRDFYSVEITVPSREFRGHARTEALARCAAALRKRAAIDVACLSGSNTQTLKATRC